MASDGEKYQHQLGRSPHRQKAISTNSAGRQTINLLLLPASVNSSIASGARQAKQRGA